MNFDKPINRSNSNSHKWAITNDTEHKDVVAMTVADMDFETPAFITNNLIPDSNVLGYDAPLPEYFDAIINWQKQHHHLDLTADEIIPLTGVLPGISYTLRTVTKPGDNVLIFDPVYDPFSNLVHGIGRQLIEFNLTIDEEDQYQIDFDQLAHALVKTDAIILCNPQNPSGHVWSKTDLKKIVTLARQNNVFIISDEIHEDLVFNPADFTSLLEIPESEDVGIVISAPTKTFNMPGLKTAYLFVKDAFLANQINKLMGSEFTNGISTTGLRAARFALSQGEEWHSELMKYLRENRDAIYQMLSDSDNIQPMLPEATYLMWLDFTATGLTESEINERLINEAKVQLNIGSHYGMNGDSWFRLNFATPRPQLVESVQRIIDTFD